MIEQGENGWRISCERCESSVDLEGEYLELKVPDGWNSAESMIDDSDPFWDSTDLLDLCPSCVKSFKEWLNANTSVPDRED